MKFKHVLFAMAIPALAILSSCGGDTGTEKPKPTLNFETGTGYTSSAALASVDSLLKIGIRASSSDQKLKAVKVTISTNGGTALTYWDTAINTKIFNYDLKYKVAGSVADMLTMTVTATDDNGETVSKTLSIEIAPATVAIGRQQGFKVYNIIGASPGAFDLNTSANKTTSDPATVKDLIDMTVSTGANAGVFSKSWTSGNGTKYVKVTADDYNNATSSNFLYNLWKSKSSTATTTVSNLATGDVILVKTGQAIRFNIYIIKVTAVNATPVGDNSDYVEFEYKGDI